MKRFFFFLSLLISVSIGQMWGAEQLAYTLTPVAGSNNSYTGNCDVEISDITWNVAGNASLTPWRLGGKSISNTDREVYSKTAMSNAITKVELTVGAASSITVNSLKLIVASDASFSNNKVIDEVTKTFAASSTITFTPTSPATEWATSSYYKFVFNVTVSGKNNKFVEFSGVKFYKEVTTETCEDPTFSPTGGITFYGSQEITISTNTAGASIYYTTDGSTPSSSNGTLYEDPFSIDETTTIKAITIKEGATDSQVAEATYTKGTSVTSFEIDFETNNVAAYVNWDFVNIGIKSAISAHGGTYYGANINGSGNGVTTASITTKEKYANPGILTFFISKESTNTTASSWVVQVSDDGETWTNVGDPFAAQSMSSGTWNECAADLSEYSNVYVRISYGSSGAIRAIDDISLTTASSVAKPTISGETPFLNTTDVTISIPDGTTVYYTTNGSDPTTNSTEYTAPFALTKSTTVKAIAVNGNDISGVASKEFTKITVMTVAEARAAIDAGSDLSNKYVAGIISQIDSYNSTYNSITYWISDDGTTTDQLEVYSGLAGVVKAQFASVEDLAVGDDVTVNGTLKKYNSTYEFDKNNTIVAYKPIARLSWSESSYEADLSGSNTFPTLTKPDGITVSYSSSDPSKAEINSSTGVITLKAVGSTTITATFAGNATYKANSASYTLNVANSVVRGTITYNVDGGSEVEALEDQTALPDPLPTTTKAGKNFGGWFTDSQKTIAAVAGAAIDGDITLYAKWLDPYTVAEAKTVIDGLNGGTKENQYVTGVISQIDSYNNSYHSITYWISADGTTDNQLEVYSGLIGNAATALDKEQFTDKTDLQLGDQVVVCGTLKKYNDVYEFDKNNTIYSFSRSEVAVSSVELQESTAEVEEGKTVTLHASVLPANASNKSITWTVQSGDAYASVANGVVTGIAEGSAVIRATSVADGTKYAECTVTVTAATPLSPWASVYTSNITLDKNASGGSNVSDAKVLYDETEYVALKAGTSSKTGAIVVIVPAGTTKLHFHAYGWSGETVALTVEAPKGVTVTPPSVNIAENTGVSGSSTTYTLAEGSNPKSDAYYAVTLSDVTEATAVKFTATGGKRFVIFGVNQEGATTPASIAADPTSLAFGSVEQGSEVDAKTINVTLTEVTTATIALSGDGASAFSIDKTALSESGAITVTPNTTTVGTYAATITISDDASKAQAVEVAVSMTVTSSSTPSSSTKYRKVTSTADITNGEYLIVYEDGYLAFNGDLDKLDAVGNCVTVTISQGVITGSEAIDAAVFTIDATNKSIQSHHGEYIGQASDANGLTASETADIHKSLSIDADGNFVAESSGGAFLRYNTASNQTRFRYYKSTSYTNQQAIQLYKKESATPPTPDYGSYQRDELTVGNYGTICLPNAGTIANAKLFDLEYYDGASTLYLLEVNGNAMVAGRPYIFLPSATSIEVTYTNNAGEDAGSFNGLVGSYTQETITADAGNYILYQNAYYLVNSPASVGANRAYIHMTDVPNTPASTPQGDAPRRRVAMNVNGRQVATGISDIETSEQPMKVMIDGKLYIIRAGQMYDMTGSKVK